MEATESITIARLKKILPESILEVIPNSSNDTILVKKEDIIKVLSFLKEDKELDYTMLMDITAVDYLKHPVKRKERFELVYVLYSFTKYHRVIIKCAVNAKDPTALSACGLWNSANWGEREVFDMFGIKFINHPNLKRVLNHHEFVGYPLRKDYPIKKRQTLSVNDSLMDEMEEKLKEKGLK